MAFRILFLPFLTVSLLLAAVPSRALESIAPGNRHGIVSVSDDPFPVPAGSEIVPIPDGDFETPEKAGNWDIVHGKIVTAPDAPQGRSYLQLQAFGLPFVRMHGVPAAPGRPYFISFWWKSPGAHWASIEFPNIGHERLSTPSHTGVLLPETQGKWKRVGIYFWMNIPAKMVEFMIGFRNEPEQPGQYIGLDDIQLRSATDAEMAAAYEAERAHLPPYDITPRPGDGSNLALSVAKWEGKAGIPGKPFVIWGIGSSWTEAQRDGYGLIHAIRERFPNAPQIIYKEHDGAGTPWDYDASWVKQWVAPEQPDLVFTYTPGTLEGLDRLLTEIRKRTTADIIIPSIHFQVTSKMTPDEVENGFVSWAAVRELCARHHAEFVENRRDLAAYMKANNLTGEDLLWDHVHQNQHLRIRVWDNVTRHITDPGKFTYAPDQLERTIAVDPPAATATEKVTLTGNWTSSKGSVTTKDSSAKMEVHFTGNRIDLIGHKLAGGGTLKVLIDGVPADQFPAFAGDYIKPTPKIWPKKNVGGQPGDVAPQAVDLGANIVPQSWNILMTSDHGDYQITGSVTGPDGTGNVAQRFTSKSGQIIIDPIDWRNGVLKPGPGTPPGPPQFGNVTGDQFDFDVCRTAVSTVSFASDASIASDAASFSVPLVQNIPNHEHTLTLVPTGDGPVQIDSLYVFNPMEK